MKFKTRGSVCNISLLRTSDWTYPSRILACKWSGSLYNWLLIMITRCWGFDDMLTFYIYIDMCYWLVFLSVHDPGPLRVPMASRDLLGLQIESWSGLLWFECFLYYICDIWLDIMMLIFIADMFCWWMQVDDSFPTILTFGVRGSRSTTRDIEGEVWNPPYRSIQALSPWLEL